MIPNACGLALAARALLWWERQAASGEQGRTPMPTLVATPTRIEAAGNKPKLIDEYIGHVNSRTEALSIAHMRSPGGWVEPGQTPDFEEYTVVLKGILRIEYIGGHLDVQPGQAVIAHAGEWVRYSTPTDEGAEYLAVCLPAFSPMTVHRDEE
jgi:mannose-6-phosphate isomerase-like protein (cupin superfamily)